MHFVIFCHSLCSDWNHGNAHFLRGIASELLARGHEVHVHEPRDAWSVQNLAEEYGDQALDAYRDAYPHLTSERYDLDALDLDRALARADVVLVHEWNDHALVARIGEHRASRGDYRLFFHDTHHRSVSDHESMRAYDLRHYDGVLAFGGVIRDRYLSERWTPRAWTWHEAADTSVFKPISGQPIDGDLVWIGNWGDEERTEELQEFLLEPVRRLRLRARVYGVRYPEHARRRLAEAGIEHGGWLPNHRVPDVFARYRVTVHVPRRPYVQTLRGVPTIRPFEALACGIPLVSSPWDDVEHLFTPGEDFLVARNGDEMTTHLDALLSDASRARAQAARGRCTILARHTCAHRVNELLAILRELEDAASDRAVVA